MRRSLFDDQFQLEHPPENAALTAELLGKMLTVMKVCGPHGVWSARAAGSNQFGHGPTPLVAMQEALALLEPKPSRRKVLL